jgi:hypothetical protein
MKRQNTWDHNIPFSNIQPPSLTTMNVNEFNLRVAYYKYLSRTPNAKFHSLELNAKKSETRTYSLTVPTSIGRTPVYGFLEYYK